tara:strand:+ start:56447 stop:57277 length:831 start_codon:yes stop_codon:yes gene_type:complete
VGGIAMDVQQLMEVKPEMLAEGLLARWKALEEQLPNVIRNLEAEEEALAPKVKRAVEAHATANDVVANNKQKRNTAQKIAREKLVEVRQSVDTLSKTGGMVNLDPEWKKMKLLEELENIESTIETSALDHREEGRLISKRRKLIEQNEKWLKERRASNPEMSKYLDSRKIMVSNFKASETAHSRMMKAVEKAQPLYEKMVALKEEIRDTRRQLDRAKELYSQSSDAIALWEVKVSSGFGDEVNGFDDLLIDMNRVLSGGASSFAMRKGKKGKEEEE